MTLELVRPEPKPALATFLAWALPILFLDCMVWFVAFPAGLMWPAAAFAHLLLVGLTYLAIPWHRWRQLDLRYVCTNALLGTFLGPFGMAATVVAGCLASMITTDGVYIDTLLKELLPELNEHRITESARRLRAGLERVDVNTTPVPFLDIMAFGSMEQKRAVIGAALRYFSPELTTVLKTGLQDKTNSIRVLAATALVTLEGKYHSRFIELQQEVADHPEDPEALQAYARHCFAFAFSNILGEERASKMRQHAIDAYELLQKEQGSSLDLCTSLARLYSAENRFSEALKVLDPWMKKESDPEPKVLNLYAEALFLGGQYEELRMLSQKYAKELERTTDAGQIASPLGVWSIPKTAG